MCVCLWEIKYSSHKKQLSSLSSTLLYNGGPVKAQTGGIVTHTYGAPDTIWEFKNPLTESGLTGLREFFTFTS